MATIYEKHIKYFIIQEEGDEEVGISPTTRKIADEYNDYLFSFYDLTEEGLSKQLDEAKRNIMEMFGDGGSAEVIFDFEHQKELEAERLRELEMEADAQRL